jgi:hypothetical protein
MRSRARKCGSNSSWPPSSNSITTTLGSSVSTTIGSDSHSPEVSLWSMRRRLIARPHPTHESTRDVRHSAPNSRDHDPRVGGSSPSSGTRQTSSNRMPPGARPLVLPPAYKSRLLVPSSIGRMSCAVRASGSVNPNRLTHQRLAAAADRRASGAAVRSAIHGGARRLGGRLLRCGATRPAPCWISPGTSDRTSMPHRRCRHRERVRSAPAPQTARERMQ